MCPQSLRVTSGKNQISHGSSLAAHIDIVAYSDAKDATAAQFAMLNGPRGCSLCTESDCVQIRQS